VAVVGIPGAAASASVCRASKALVLALHPDGVAMDIEVPDLVYSPSLQINGRAITAILRRDSGSFIRAGAEWQCSCLLHPGPFPD
jgi:hypothetical protein